MSVTAVVTAGTSCETPLYSSRSYNKSCWCKVGPIHLKESTCDTGTTAHSLPVSTLLWLHSLILRMTLWLPGNIIFPLMSRQGFCVCLVDLRPIASLDIGLPEQQPSSQLFPHTSTSPCPSAVVSSLEVSTTALRSC